MRYKIIDGVITFFLSGREVLNYDDGQLGLKSEGNVILDYNMPFIVQNGEYPIAVNGHPIELKMNVEETAIGFTVKVVANDFPFEVSYIDEVDKYKVYRGVVKNLKQIVKSPQLDWHVLESNEFNDALTLIVTADDPDVLADVKTLKEIDLIAKRKGFLKRTHTAEIRLFGQNELPRRTIRYERS